MTISTENNPLTATAYPMPEEGTGLAMTSLPNASTVTMNGNSPYAVPPLPASDLQIPMHEQTKLGRKCCGCCCDFRRAVIIINSIVIGLSAYNLFSLLNPPEELTMEALEESQSVEVDDDAVLKELDQIAHDGFIANAIIGGILVVLTVVPLYGAYMFKVRLIAFGVVLLVASFVAEFTMAYFLVQDADNVSDELSFAQPYFFYSFSAIVTSLFIYPHVGLIMEIRQGIMSMETYPREEYSCCCGTSSRPSNPQAYNNSNGGVTAYQ